jgi:hypothetical protein
MNDYYRFKIYWAIMDSGINLNIDLLSISALAYYLAETLNYDN